MDKQRWLEKLREKERATRTETDCGGEHALSGRTNHGLTTLPSDEYAALNFSIDSPQ